MYNVVAVTMCVYNKNICSMCVPTEFQPAEVWPSMNDTDDPELIELASQLPATALKSRADSSTKKYLGAYHHWRNWAKLPVFPASARHIVLYLQSIGNRLQSKSAVEAVRAVAWAHHVAGLESPTTNPLVQTIILGLK